MYRRVRESGTIHSSYRRKLYRSGTCRSLCRQKQCFRFYARRPGIGLGFTIALTLLGSVRELLGTGKVFDMVIYPEHYGSLIFVLAPGAFIALGYLIAIVNKLKTK